MQDSTAQPDPTVLAAEYVLRLLPPDEERRVALRLVHDAALRREVRAWAGWLGGLAHDLPPAAPRDDLHRDLSARLFSEG